MPYDTLLGKDGVWEPRRMRRICRAVILQTGAVAMPLWRWIDDWSHSKLCPCRARCQVSRMTFVSRQTRRKELRKYWQSIALLMECLHFLTRMNICVIMQKLSSSAYSRIRIHLQHICTQYTHSILTDAFIWPCRVRKNIRWVGMCVLSPKQRFLMCKYLGHFTFLRSKGGGSTEPLPVHSDKDKDRSLTSW